MTTRRRLEFRGTEEFPGSFGDGFGCSDEPCGSLLPDAPLQPVELTVTLADAGRAASHSTASHQPHASTRIATAAAVMPPSLSSPLAASWRWAWPRRLPSSAASTPARRCGLTRSA